MTYKSLSCAALFGIVLSLFSCEEPPYLNSPGDNVFNQDSVVTPPSAQDPITADPDSIDIPEGTLTVLQALDSCAKLASGETSGTKYYIKGWVKKLHTKHIDGVENYGNAQFYIAPTNDPEDTNDFLCYQVYGKDGQKISDPDMVQVGDFVIVYGEITNYNGTYETVGRGAAYIHASTNALFNQAYSEDKPQPITPDPAGANVPEGTLNVYQANDICKSLASGAETADKYYVKGYVKKLHSNNTTAIANYGNAQFYISPTNDGTATEDFMAYQVYGKDGQKITDASAVAEGDFVVLYGKLTNYNGTYETVGRGAAYIYYSTNPNW